MPSSKVPGAVCDSGRPALSSASIPQRASKADTRAASCRSGVTSAAVLPGVSSASRSASAIACASAAASGSSASANSGQPPFGRRQVLPFVARSRARPSRWRPPAPRAGGDAAPPERSPGLHFLARDAHAIEQQLQMELRMGLLASALLVGPERVPFLLGHEVGEPQPGRTTIPSGIRATGRQRRDRRRGGGDAGRDGEPGGGSLFHRSAIRRSKTVAPLGEVDRARAARDSLANAR